MENIIYPNKEFDFSKLKLAQPSMMQGNTYFTQILNNDLPIYIQTSRSLTRQGIIKNGKKYFCDLMFDNNSEDIIQWFEKLEEKCQQLLYSKSESWFQNTLEMGDIENAFNSAIRIYKSGKYYLIRVNIKTNSVGEPSIKIFNENETLLNKDILKSDTNIISVLEIQGIKFTPRNFQFEIEIKQIMVLDTEPIFDKCLIKKSIENKNNNENIIIKNNDLENIKNIEDSIVIDNFENFENSENIEDSIVTDNFENSENIEDKEDKEVQEDKEEEKNKEYKDKEDKDKEDKEEDKEKEDKEEEEEDKEDKEEEDKEYKEDKEDNKEDKIKINFFDFDNETDNLKEIDIDINLEENLEPFKLKKQNDVYYKIYKEAKNKAKNAKKNAIIAYLEAKNIKNIYNLELSDSDSEFDAEIDEISESELDNF